MNDISLKRSQTAIEKDHWISLIRVYRFLKQECEAGRYVSKLPLRKLLEEVLDVGETTAKKIISLSNGTESLREVKQLGRPKKVLTEEYIHAMRTFVLERAKTGEQVTAQLLQDYLKTENFEAPCLTILKEDMKKAGLRFGQGQRQNILHDSDEIVAYREKYVSRRLDNLNRNGLPIKAEVFLDESYCHLDHHAKRTWYVPGSKINEAGRKPMLVMFGAFIVFSQGNALHAKCVEENIVIWPVKGKSHVEQPEALTGEKRKRKPGRPSTKITPEAWKNLPKCVKDAKIAPDFNDYHGNFNASLFEKLFERLCKKLKDQGFECIIHMDGAKYHFRKNDPIPSGQEKVDVLRDWYLKNNHPLPLPTKPGKPVTKKQLVEDLKQLKKEHPVTYASCETARAYGHEIQKTPPYHCELQPIEGLWGIVKQKVAYNRVPNCTEVQLARQLYTYFSKVEKRELISLWRKTVMQCQAYSENSTEEN